MHRFWSLFILVVLLVALAAFLGWIDFSSTSNSDKVNLGLSINKNKMSHDFRRGGERARELGRDARDEVKDLGRKLDRDDKQPWQIDKNEIAIQPGWSTSAKITRQSTDKGDYQLKLNVPAD